MNVEGQFGVVKDSPSGDTVRLGCTRLTGKTTFTHFSYKKKKQSSAGSEWSKGITSSSALTGTGVGGEGGSSIIWGTIFHHHFLMRALDLQRQG